MGGTPDTWVTPDSDSSCSESAAADTSAGKGRCMRRWGSFPFGGGVGGGRFAAITVAVRSYPHVRSSPHLPYITLSTSGANTTIPAPPLSLGSVAGYALFRTNLSSCRCLALMYRTSLVPVVNRVPQLLAVLPRECE